MKKNTGFTLIELMIVVAIIAIIAAIAIPSLLRSKQSANEGAALGAMRTISTAEASYQAANLTVDATGIGQYTNLAGLFAVPFGAPFIDETLAAGIKHGYNFVAAPVAGNPPTYTANADPANASAGAKTYFVDESGVLRGAVGAAATAASLPIQ